MAVQTLKFKRGTFAALTEKLKPISAGGIGVLEAGEPAFETDTSKLKVGDGVSAYADLPYVAGGGGGEDPRFVIHDPEANQVLLYDETTQKWVNKDLADSESIIYLSARGLTIKGYTDASVGQMLVKDHDNGLAWINPISTQELDAKVQLAADYAATAGNKAIEAGNKAIEAANSATTAQLINEQTVEYVENKFWWGTLAEYNALPQITEGTIYFIKPGA